MQNMKFSQQNSCHSKVFKYNTTFLFHGNCIQIGKFIGNLTHSMHILLSICVSNWISKKKTNFIYILGRICFFIIEITWQNIRKWYAIHSKTIKKKILKFQCITCYFVRSLDNIQFSLCLCTWQMITFGMETWRRAIYYWIEWNCISQERRKSNSCFEIELLSFEVITEFISSIMDFIKNIILAQELIFTFCNICWTSFRWFWLDQTSSFFLWNTVASFNSIIQGNNVVITTDSSSGKLIFHSKMYLRMRILSLIWWNFLILANDSSLCITSFLWICCRYSEKNCESDNEFHDENFSVILFRKLKWKSCVATIDSWIEFDAYTESQRSIYTKKYRLGFTIALPIFLFPIVTLSSSFPFFLSKHIVDIRHAILLN